MANRDTYEFRNKLVEQAKHELINNPSSIQVTLFETITGEIIPFFLYDLKTNKDEDDFFDKLKNTNKNKINHILAMWKDNTIDIPKRSILLKVHELDEQNCNTCVLSISENGLSGFKLSNLL